MSVQDKNDDSVPEQSGLAQSARNLEGRLPSGRQVVVRVEDAIERLEIRSAQGELEVALELTDHGPVLRLSGVKLEIESTDTIAVNCKEFRVNTTQGIALNAVGDVELQTASALKMKSHGDTAIDADWLNLNCEERAGSGYHDDPEIHPETAVDALPAADNEG